MCLHKTALEDRINFHRNLQYANAPRIFLIVVDKTSNTSVSTNVIMNVSTLILTAVKLVKPINTN